MSDISGCSSCTGASTTALAKSLAVQKTMVGQLLEGLSPVQTAVDAAQISEQALALLRAEESSRTS